MQTLDDFFNVAKPEPQKAEQQDCSPAFLFVVVNLSDIRQDKTSTSIRLDSVSIVSR